MPYRVDRDDRGGFTLLGYIVARPFTTLERLGNNTLAVVDSPLAT